MLSTPPADQMGTPPAYATAAMKVGGEVGGSKGRKPRKYVVFWEDHVWFGLEAYRDEPGFMAAVMVERRRRRKSRS